MLGQRPQSVFESQDCRIGNRKVPLQVVERLDREHPQTNLFRCTLPADLPLANIGEITLSFNVKRGQQIEHIVKLEKSVLPEKRPKLGVCVSPLFGDMDMLQLVEWRVHHARVGFGAVHFYERVADEYNMARWINIWNTRLGTQDTLGVGAPVSPSTWQTHAYVQNSTYADQVRPSIAF